MSCDRELLDLYVAGALDGDRVARVESHLSTCVACRTEERETKKLLAQVAAQPQRDPGDKFFVDMARDIRKAVAEVDARPRGFGAWVLSFWRPLAVGGLVAAVAVALLVVLAMRGGEKKSVARAPQEAPAPVKKQQPLPKMGDLDDMEDAQLDAILANLEDDEEPEAEDEDEEDLLGDDAALHDAMEDLDEEELDRVYAALEKGV